jgi:hypothetical protein
MNTVPREAGQDRYSIESVAQGTNGLSLRFLQLHTKFEASNILIHPTIDSMEHTNDTQAQRSE